MENVFVSIVAYGAVDNAERRRSRFDDILARHRARRAAMLVMLAVSALTLALLLVV